MDNNLVITTKEELQQLIEIALEKQLGKLDFKSDKSTTELITTKQLEKVLGKSSTTIWRYMKDGRIPYKKLGVKNYFDLSEVMKSLKSFNIQDVEVKE
ncbi:helix-turn-helix domain-containing protein [Candidatus Kapabacteria bacterium]|nr:helix-turn-helix domain-containing protein [Candidatus Kapabacteria bacterium]